MSDLVRRLREWWEYDTGYLMSAAIARIEQLERELAIAEKMAADANEAYSQAHVSMIEALDQLTAEKALADELYEGGVTSNHFGFPCYKAYRKARGLE